MRLIALVAVCGVLGWLLISSGPSVEPMKPDPRLPTFRQMVDADGPRRATPVQESAEHRKLRQAMLNAASRLESSPCDKSLRPPFRAAVAAYMKARTYDDPPVSEEEGEIIREGAMAGILQPEDLFGDGYRLLSALQGKSAAKPPADYSSHGGRFACRIGDD